MLPEVSASELVWPSISELGTAIGVEPAVEEESATRSALDEPAESRNESWTIGALGLVADGRRRSDDDDEDEDFDFDEEEDFDEDEDFEGEELDEDFDDLDDVDEEDEEEEEL